MNQALLSLDGFSGLVFIHDHLQPVSQEQLVIEIHSDSSSSEDRGSTGHSGGALQRSNSHLQTGLECTQPHALPERQWVSVYPHQSNQWRVNHTPLTGSALGCAKAASSPSAEPAPIRHESIRATAASNVSVSAARGYRLSDTRAMAFALRDIIGRHEDKTLKLLQSPLG